MVAGIAFFILVHFSVLSLSASFSIPRPSLPQRRPLASSSIYSTNNDDDFLSSLRTRVQEVEDSSTKLPLMILDTMLPRQALQITIEHPTLMRLMRHRLQMETPTLGMLGMTRLGNTMSAVPLRSGVEVEIVQMEKSSAAGDDSGSDSGDTEDGGDGEWDITLRATRRFRISGEISKTEHGWTEARVEFLNSRDQEEQELQKSSTQDGDRFSVARAISKSKQFTDPNFNIMSNNAADDGSGSSAPSLIERWIELAKQNERHKNQIDNLLRQLGDIPPEEEPTERALWVGALINPLPAMGVAMEIRPALLMATKAEDRVEVALEGLLKSIRHMDGTARMW